MVEQIDRVGRREDPNIASYTNPGRRAVTLAANAVIRAAMLPWWLAERASTTGKKALGAEFRQEPPKDLSLVFDASVPHGLVEIKSVVVLGSPGEEVTIGSSLAGIPNKEDVVAAPIQKGQIVVNRPVSQPLRRPVTA